MGARLALSLVSLAVTLGLEAAGGEFTTAEWRGFYATIVFAFSATILYGAVVHRFLTPKHFATLNVLTDVGIVTALVHFSGGSESVFPFLYLLVAGYSAFLFNSRGALAVASMSIACYGGVLMAAHLGWISGVGIGPPEPVNVIVSSWLVNAGAVAIVAVLASLLTSELRRTGAALDQRTTDLHRLQDLHRRTVESLMSGLLTTDRAFTITSFNPEAERITGVSFEAAVGCEVDEILPGVRALAAQAEENDENQYLRTRMAFSNQAGEQLHLGVAVYILRDSEAAPDGFVVIFQDVTRVVEMEDDLRRNERLAAIGQLSASIAHEVRNPLASISGSIQILRGQINTMTGSGETRRLMDIVLRETDRLNRLITDFLEYARPGPASPESVDVQTAVAEVVEMFEAARTEGLEVEIAVPPGLRLVADPSQLRQVIWNLVLNASDAMPTGGRLLIGAGAFTGELPQDFVNDGRNVPLVPKKTGWAEIFVTDTGSGMSPGECERVFDPFYTTKEGGSGLGLAAVHRIVSEHSGSAKLESRTGEGTTVRLRFPRAEVVG